MSESSWLFLFAACGAVGGIATFWDLLWRLVTANAAAGPMNISRARAWFTSVLLLGSLVLSVLGFLSIYENSQEGMFPHTLAWGPLSDKDGNITGCAVATDTTPIKSWADKYWVVLVSGISDASVDQVEDTRIAISNPFNITGGTQEIVDNFKDPKLLAAFRNTPAHNVSQWQRVIVVRKGTDLDEIKRLSDVPRFGGKLFP